MYLKQRNNFDCAPICIINGIIWASGKTPTLIFYNKLKKSMGYKNGFGTSIANFDKYIKKTKDLPFKIKATKKNPSLSFIKKAIKQNKAVIFGTDNGLNGHICLVLAGQDNNFKFIPWGKFQSSRKVSLAYFKEILNNCWVVAYVIDKKTKKDII